MDLDKKELMVQYEETLSHLGSYNTNRYNLLTVRNFIIHFDEIEYAHKKNVYDKIYYYLVSIRNIGLPETNSDSIQLFDSYLSELMVYYSRIGFITYLSYESYIYITTILLPIFFLLQLSIYWYISLGLIILAHSLRVYLKIKQQRVFGHKY